MTSIVALEKISNLNEMVQVPANALYNVDGYTEAGFKVGDAVTYQDLLYGTLLPSGADAAQSLALLTYGDFDSFVNAMNEKAHTLDMANTHYSNPVGRDSEENYSTLQDLLKLLLYALDNEDFYKAYTTRTYTTINNLELTSTLVVPSQMYHLNIEEIKGSKSGFTSKAGLCLSSIAENDGVKYLLLTAGSKYQNGFPNHIVDTLTLYHYFFENFTNTPILEENQVLKTIPRKDATQSMYEIKSPINVSMYLNKNEVENLVYEYQGIQELNSKIKQNTKLGTIKVKYKEEELYAIDVYMDSKIQYKYTKEILLVSIILLLLILMFFLIKKIRKRKN